MLRAQLLLLSLWVTLWAMPGWATGDPFPDVANAYLVIRDGQPLWGAHADRQLAPASLTKMMMALVAIEDGRLDAVAVVSRNAARETGSRLGLRAGERMRLHDLLAAAVIRSANDACRAVADHVGGTTERFIAAMNARARALGLRNTRFADPCGHDRAGHYSSAEDLAVVAQTLLQHPTYVQLAQAEQATIVTSDGRRTFSFGTTNALIGRYPGVVGLKTGFTRRAGKCLVAFAQRDGVRVLLVMLNAPNRWLDAVEILDRAFAFDAR